jgi:hypothetical protein
LSQLHQKKKEKLRDLSTWGNHGVRMDAYSFDLLPLHVCHFNTEEGFRPLLFIHFTVQNKEPYILGTAGSGEQVYWHILISYSYRVEHNAFINNRKDLT